MRLAPMLVAGLLCLLAAAPAAGTEIRSRYATLSYDQPELLRRFNKKVRLGSFFSFGGGASSVNQEVSSKLDQFGGRVQEILEMYPARFQFKVVLLDDVRAVDNVYAEQYRIRKGFIAFFSPKTDTIYVSVDDVDRHVLAHELAHAVIHHYFQKAPPTKIHELLAQYVESQL